MDPGGSIAVVKAASLALSLIVAAPYGAALADPPAAAPRAPLYGPPPGAASPAASPPAASPPATSPARPWLGPPSEAAPFTASPTPPPEERSAFVAFSLSFSMPIAAILAGAYLMDPDEGAGETAILVAAIAGPSTGWLYAGRPLHGLATAATRLAGGLLMVRVFDDSASAGSDEGLILLGAAAFVTATLVDWIGVPRAVLRDNARARATLVPAAPSGGGVGLSLVGSF